MTATPPAPAAPSNPITTRPMERSDVNIVAAIEARVNPSPWPYQLFEGELVLPPNSRHWLVASSGPNAVVGFGGIMFAADTAHLMNLGVAPEAGRQGIGLRLCVELFDEARRRGAVDLTLEVRTSNTRAISLYDKFDMTSAGTRPRYYPDGEDALIMWIHDLHSAEVDARLEELSRS